MGFPQFRFHNLPFPHSFWLELILRHPTVRTATWYRAKTGVQLDSSEILAILKTLNLRQSCRLLVFGLGKDSLLWHAANSNGKTDFLEDDAEWIAAWKRRNSDINCHRVEYTSRLADSLTILKGGCVELPPLPKQIEDCVYDVILVDAPAGCGEANQPGRTQSIALARHLAAPGADVFVHDCDRKVEQVACSTIFQDAELIEEVNRLRHYKLATSGLLG